MRSSGGLLPIYNLIDYRNGVCNCRIRMCPYNPAIDLISVIVAGVGVLQDLYVVSTVFVDCDPFRHSLIPSLGSRLGSRDYPTLKCFLIVLYMIMFPTLVRLFTAAYFGVPPVLENPQNSPRSSSPTLNPNFGRSTSHTVFTF